MRNKPSLKVLEAAFPTKGKALRRLLTSKQAVLDHPAAIAYSRQCYHKPPVYLQRLYALNAETESFGVEYTHHSTCEQIGRCTNKCFDYLNAGDTYATTIIRFNDGRYRVGDWGTVVERGNYE